MSPSVKQPSYEEFCRSTLVLLIDTIYTEYPCLRRLRPSGWRHDELVGLIIIAPHKVNAHYHLVINDIRYRDRARPLLQAGHPERTREVDMCNEIDHSVLVLACLQ